MQGHTSQVRFHISQRNHTHLLRVLYAPTWLPDRRCGAPCHRTAAHRSQHTAHQDVPARRHSASAPPPQYLEAPEYLEAARADAARVPDRAIATTPSSACTAGAGDSETHGPHFIARPFMPADAPANMSPILSCSFNARRSSSSKTLFETKSKPSKPFWSSGLRGHCARIDIEVFM